MNTHKQMENLLDEDYKETMKIKATNPYSNESTMLTPEEHKLYIEIKTAEFDEDYNTMQKKLSKFSRLNASAFRTTLTRTSCAAALAHINT